MGIKNKTDVYWHIYQPEQIRSARRGQLIYVLEIPTVPGPPVMRSIFDPAGERYPANLQDRLGALFADRRDHGLVFTGVNEKAVDDLLSLDPDITADDPLFFNYNWAVIRNTLDHLLLSEADPFPEILRPFATTRHALPGVVTGRNFLSYL